MATVSIGNSRRTLAWRPSVAVGILVISGTAAAAFWFHHFDAIFLATQSAEPKLAEIPPSGVGALGRIEPGWKVFSVSPSSGADGTRVDQLLIEEGQLVKENDVLAILDTLARRRAAVKEAEAQVTVSQAGLDLVLAGAK